MKNRVTVISVLWIMILGASIPLSHTYAMQVPEGFTALFNGKNLDGWYGHGTKDPQTLWDMTPEELKAHKEKTREDILQHWTAENGELVNDGKGLYATTDKDYGDFELLVDYKTVALADSGIYLRGCPQVQIWDTTEAGGKHGIGADKGSGGLWNNAKGSAGKDPSKLMDKPFGQWNSFRIIMVGSRVTIWMNGERIVDHAVMHNYFNRKRPIYPTGPIQLQTHGGEIRWRNVFIREIDAVEANRILRKGGPERRGRNRKFTKIFNGKDMEGWTGDQIDKIEVKRNQLFSEHGTIYTEKTYSDFVVRFDFKLPPGGNNGLAIRYPGGNVDTAYHGMCELQVLDNTAAKYAKLKPQQYHGSVYGMVAAQRGYLREAGQWNFQEVQVQGSTIKVELNGTVIVDADLSKLDPATFMSSRFKVHGHASGHFGFAGHGDPVAYRNIQIKEL
jgi:hypothetical protein